MPVRLRAGMPVTGYTGHLRGVKGDAMMRLWHQHQSTRQRRRNQAVAPKQFAGVRTLAPSPPAARRPVTSRDPVAPKGMWRSLSNSKLQ